MRGGAGEPGPRRRELQWLIIQGRAPEKVFAARALGRKAEAPPQHPQAAPWLRRGAFALRSLAAWARFRPGGTAARFGVPVQARGAGRAQPGQAQGSPEADIGRNSLNGPQAGQP